jgi:Amt family ammonium transporter
VNVSSLCIFIALWHVLVYCPLAHMVWYPTGLIRMFGVIDFAGASQILCMTQTQLAIIGILVRSSRHTVGGLVAKSLLLLPS